jgi:hypothetical protein
MPEDKVDEDKCHKEPEAKPEEELKKEEGMDEEEEETEEEKKKKKSKLKAKKGEGLSENPEESAASGADGNSTISPGAIVPGKGQNVFVPQSSIKVSREQETPMGKSAEPDLMKSPVYLGIMKQLDGMQEAIVKKTEAMGAAIQKSMEDRLANTKKEVDNMVNQMQKFYNQPMYKALGENVAPEGAKSETVSEQIAKGKVRFSN